MKKILLFILIGLLILFLIFSLNNDSELIINNEDVVMEVNGEITENTIYLTLTNLTADEYNYGVEYYIQKYENDKWTTLKTINDVVFIAVEYILDTNSSREITISLNNYDTLTDGTYRVIKEIFKTNSDDTYSETINISAEFIIEN